MSDFTVPVGPTFPLAFHFFPSSVLRRRARLASGPIVQLQPNSDVAERNDQERQHELQYGRDGTEYL